MKRTCPKCRSRLSPTNKYCAVCETLNSSFQESPNESFETSSTFSLEQIRQRDDFDSLFASPLTECSIGLNKENFDYYQLALNIRKMVLVFVFQWNSGILFSDPCNDRISVFLY
ncbi:MAG: hypothetical protein Q4C95_04865 [Planctomycetia bacterium]|nr:hypothetical protein [Planctomycetia bacterium]